MESDVLPVSTTKEAIKARTRLADFEVPKVIRIISALPKNAMGKVERRRLAALFARQS